MRDGFASELNCLKENKMAAFTGSHFVLEKIDSFAQPDIYMKIYWFLFLTFLFSCHDNKTTGKSIVELIIKSARDKTVYIETIPYEGEEKEILDSLVINSGDFSGRLSIKKIEERPLVLKISGTDIRIIFINDVREITVKANIIRPREYSIEKSPANRILKSFYDGQASLIAEGKKLSDELQLKKEIPQRDISSDSFDARVNRNLEEYFSYVKSFADTVSSPGVFLAIYNNVDFGRDIKGLNDFITRAAARFPNHARIQKLKTETTEYLKILSEEYETGQSLPDIELNDTSGYVYNTALAKGRYVFLDIWATWCGPCLKYTRPKLQAMKKFPADKFQIVSIALEPDKNFWRDYIRVNRLRWTQLVDEKVWNGVAYRSYKIDSIPFNFLLAPGGRILHKAIPPDSVVSVISRYVK
jgi:thiol-disulfide isomerase/thioredoxin